MQQFLKRLDHLGIAVRDLSAAMATYGDSLGLTDWEVIDMPERAMQVAIGRVGETLLELITPTSPAAAFSKFLDERGEGIHHIAYAVDNLEAVLARVLHLSPWIGVCLGPGNRIWERKDGCFQARRRIQQNLRCRWRAPIYFPGRR